MSITKAKQLIAPNRRMRKILLRFVPWVRRGSNRSTVLDYITIPRLSWLYRDHLKRWEQMHETTVTRTPTDESIVPQQGQSSII